MPTLVYFFSWKHWVAADAQPEAVTAKSAFSFIGYPSLCSVGPHPHPCPGSSAEHCLVTQPCCKLPRIEHKYSESWKLSMKPVLKPGTARGTSSVQAVSIWKFWISAGGQFVSMSCGSWSFPRLSLWLQLAFIRPSFRMAVVVPPRGCFLVTAHDLEKHSYCLLKISLAHLQPLPAVPPAMSLSPVLLCWHQCCQREQLANETVWVMWLAFCLLQLRWLLSTLYKSTRMDGLKLPPFVQLPNDTVCLPLAYCTGLAP